MNTTGILPNAEPSKLFHPEAELTMQPTGFQKSRSSLMFCALGCII